jgi:hypothetical protein
MAFCPQCGSETTEGARFCAACGATLAGGTYTPPPPPPRPPGGGYVGRPSTIPNYLVPAILTTVFCCLPAGIVAIVYAAQVSQKEQAGDIAGALKASQNARTWSIVSACAVVVTILIAIVFLAAGSSTTTNFR